MRRILVLTKRRDIKEVIGIGVGADFFGYVTSPAVCSEKELIAAGHAGTIWGRSATFGLYLVQNTRRFKMSEQITIAKENARWSEYQNAKGERLLKQKTVVDALMRAKVSDCARYLLSICTKEEYSSTSVQPHYLALRKFYYFLAATEVRKDNPIEQQTFIFGNDHKYSREVLEEVATSKK